MAEPGSDDDDRPSVERARPPEGDLGPGASLTSCCLKRDTRTPLLPSTWITYLTRTYCRLGCTHTQMPTLSRSHSYCPEQSCKRRSRWVWGNVMELQTGGLGGAFVWGPTGRPSWTTLVVHFHVIHDTWFWSASPGCHETWRLFCLLTVQHLHWSHHGAQWSRWQLKKASQHEPINTASWHLSNVIIFVCWPTVGSVSLYFTVSFLLSSRWWIQDSQDTNYTQCGFCGCQIQKKRKQPPFKFFIYIGNNGGSCGANWPLNTSIFAASKPSMVSNQ